VSAAYPDDLDVMVFCDKLRERVAFRGTIDRQRARLRDELATVDWLRVAYAAVSLGGFVGAALMLLSVPG
jgi:hypothetical protein